MKTKKITDFRTQYTEIRYHNDVYIHSRRFYFFNWENRLVSVPFRVKQYVLNRNYFIEMQRKKIKLYETL